MEHNMHSVQSLSLNLSFVKKGSGVGMNGGAVIVSLSFHLRQTRYKARRRGQGALKKIGDVTACTTLCAHAKKPS